MEGLQMKQQLIHTPDGVRDIFYKECKQKMILQEQLNKVLKLYGFQDIQTPTFEYADVFREEIGSINSKELFRFFDKEGNMLALRPDITPSIARVAATLLNSESLPAKLCYEGNTFINRTSYQGRLVEHTQLGAEMIGFESVESDAELLALIVESLKNVGLKEFQINIGHVSFFQSLIQEAGLDDTTEEKLLDLIDNRNYFGVEELLRQSNISEELCQVFLKIQELSGGVEILEQAKICAVNENATESIQYLQSLAELLKLYNVLDYVTFDLGMVGNFDYYTGIIFRGYTYGTGDAIVNGGRYDQLLKSFGKDIPAIGFVIIVDELLQSLQRQKIEIPLAYDNHMVIYDDAMQGRAIQLARSFRECGRTTELHKMTAEHSLEYYIQYGTRCFGKSLLYLKEDRTIELVNLRTGERQSVNATNYK